MQCADTLFITAILYQMFHASIGRENNQVGVCQEYPMCNDCSIENLPAEQQQAGSILIGEMMIETVL